MEAELIRKGLWSVIEITVDPLDKDGNSKDPGTIKTELDTKLGKRKSDCAARKAWEAQKEKKEAAHVVFDPDSDSDSSA